MLSSRVETSSCPSFYPLQIIFLTTKQDWCLFTSQRLQIFLHYLNTLAALGGVLSKQILLPPRPHLRFSSVAVIRRDDDFDGVLIHSVGDHICLRIYLLDGWHGCLQFLVSSVSVKRVSDSERSHTLSFGLFGLFLVNVVKVRVVSTEKKLFLLSYCLLLRPPDPDVTNELALELRLGNFDIFNPSLLSMGFSSFLR